MCIAFIYLYLFKIFFATFPPQEDPQLGHTLLRFKPAMYRPLSREKKYDWMLKELGADRAWLRPLMILVTLQNKCRLVA